MLTITNKSKLIFVLNVMKGVDYRHPDLAPSTVDMAIPAQTPAGEPGHRIVQKELPASITWLPGEVKSGLPDELADIEEFRTARRAGTLKVG